MTRDTARVGAIIIAAGIASSGCVASIPDGARTIFSRVNTCPAERIAVTARPDVAPHTIVKQKPPEASPPPPEVAADPERLRLWRSTHPAPNWPDVDAIGATYEVSGCGKTVHFVCAYPVVDASGPFWGTVRSDQTGTYVGFDQTWGVQMTGWSVPTGQIKGAVVCIPEGQNP